MKTVGIIGYKGSGKTSLVIGLARVLAKRGHRVATVKHTAGALDLPRADTHQHGQSVAQTAAISETDSALFFRGNSTLESVMAHLEADFVLVEGMKNQKTYPKVVCLSEGDEAQSLFDGLEILTATLSPQIVKSSVPGFRILEDEERIADLVEQKAFKLPNLDCGACGHETCYQLAREIVGERMREDACPPLMPEVKVVVGGRILPLNPFAQRLVRGTIKGLLSSLKGVRGGAIQITMEG